MRSREKRTLAIHDALGRVRVGRSYRKSQIPLTSLASYQADGARLRYGFLYGPLGIYFFFTCDGYIFAIGAAAGSRSRAKREENPVLQVSLASERSAPLQHASYHRFVPFQQPYSAFLFSCAENCFRILYRSKEPKCSVGSAKSSTSGASSVRGLDSSNRGRKN